jgi:uncharacterized glyoxalase superfamily protein PhnB
VPAHFILFVRDQTAAAAFWSAALAHGPRLDVPGMTEFDLGDGAVLGLMPEAGIQRLVGVDAAAGHGHTRAELYLHVPDPKVAWDRAVGAGAEPLSSPQPRSWGDVAGYCRCPDGHLLAFAAPAP